MRPEKLWTKPMHVMPGIVSLVLSYRQGYLCEEIDGLTDSP